MKLVKVEVMTFKDLKMGDKFICPVSGKTPNPDTINSKDSEGRFWVFTKVEPVASGISTFWTAVKADGTPFFMNDHTQVMRIII